MEFIFPKSIVCPDDKNFKKNFQAQLEYFTTYYREKFEVCKRVRPKSIAEIGVRAGYSAWAFLQAAPEASYIGYDLNQGTHGGRGGKGGIYFDWAKQILSDYDATLIEADTQRLNKLSIQPVDFFHVDGAHGINETSHDLTLAFDSTVNGGHILVDDSSNKSLPGVRQACERFLAEHNLVVEWLQAADVGHCLIQKSIEKGDMA